MEFLLIWGHPPWKVGVGGCVDFPLGQPCAMENIMFIDVHTYACVWGMPYPTKFELVISNDDNNSLKELKILIIIIHFILC